MHLRNLWLLLLIAYVSFAYWITVFSRVFTGSAGVEWQPFWTYRAILSEGKEYLIADIVNNVLLFLPIGILLGLAVTKFPQLTQKWWKGWMAVLLIGILLSTGIEMLQLYLKRGLCETDDVIHNTVGCLIGYAVIKTVNRY